MVGPCSGGWREEADGGGGSLTAASETSLGIAQRGRHREARVAVANRARGGAAAPQRRLRGAMPDTGGVAGGHATGGGPPDADEVRDRAVAGKPRREREVRRSSPKGRATCV
jgi:hypothetical protein